MPHFTTADGVRIYYEDEGAGLPLLCLAGLTRNARDFDFVAPHLDGVRMIRIDSRGRGKSGWADYKTYEVVQEARDALALLDHLGVAKAAVLGTSRGGLMAMLLAATAKERLLGVALNDVGPVIETAGLNAIKGYLGKAPPFATLAEAAEDKMAHDPRFANVPKARWITFLSHVYDETPEGLTITYDPKLYDAVAPGLEQPAMEAWPLFDAMAGLPVAVIHGANSDLLSAATVAQMQDRHPGLIVAQVPDRGHIPFLDEPAALAALAEWKGLMA
ncbi:alpha/beta fold hydrolase [Pseudooceanicola sp.]|uniref:alpha/beta fold hydrolase n=1 Tax=Pseudooceanicola sp. TaxID=1914328 RepID=UPI0035C6D9CB